jgi:hypothetical protein
LAKCFANLKMSQKVEVQCCLCTETIRWRGCYSIQVKRGTASGTGGAELLKDLAILGIPSPVKWGAM